MTNQECDECIIKNDLIRRMGEGLENCRRFISFSEEDSVLSDDEITNGYIPWAEILKEIIDEAGVEIGANICEACGEYHYEGEIPRECETGDPK